MATNGSQTVDSDLGISTDHIRVVARFRPINAKEKHEEKMQGLSGDPISLFNGTHSINVPRRNKPKLQFTLDDVIWTDSSQAQAFETLAKPLVDQVVKGYNATIFAYGQTGSGKTYTMFGPDNYSRNDQLGIIPRSIDYLFSALSESKDVINYQVNVSCIEIYKELTRDLLSPPNAKKPKRLEIYVSGKEVVIKNLTEKSCKDVDEVLHYILRAQSARNTKTTDFIGHSSSRSHCVVMISVTQRLLDDTVKASKLNFGDLAGSENAKRTGATGDTLKEAGLLMRGLLALQSVINALVEKKKHIPYKDSNLTRVLKDSLGGNSKTTLLVACSPHIWNRTETVSTLQFASRCKKIKNKAQINKRQTRGQMELEIQQLKASNLELRQRLKSGTKGTRTTVVDDEKYKNAMAEIEKLKELLRNKEDEIQQKKQDLKSKDDVITEINHQYSAKTKSLESELEARDHTIEDLQTRLRSNEVENERLAKQLEDDRKLQRSFDSHKEQLSVMMSETMNDRSNATVSVLSELQSQQQQFYTLMKGIQSNIEQVITKQAQHDVQFEELQNKEFNVQIEGSHGDGGSKKKKRKHQRMRSAMDIVPNQPPLFGDLLSVNNLEVELPDEDEGDNHSLIEDDDDDDDYLDEPGYEDLMKSRQSRKKRVSKLIDSAKGNKDEFGKVVHSMANFLEMERLERQKTLGSNENGHGIENGSNSKEKARPLLSPSTSDKSTNEATVSDDERKSDDMKHSNGTNSNGRVSNESSPKRNSRKVTDDFANGFKIEDKIDILELSQFLAKWLTC